MATLPEAKHWISKQRGTRIFLLKIGWSTYFGEHLWLFGTTNVLKWIWIFIVIKAAKYHYFFFFKKVNIWNWVFMIIKMPLDNFDHKYFVNIKFYVIFTRGGGFIWSFFILKISKKNLKFITWSAFIYRVYKKMIRFTIKKKNSTFQNYWSLMLMLMPMHDQTTLKLNGIWLLNYLYIYLTYQFTFKFEILSLLFVIIKIVK